MEAEKWDHVVSRGEGDHGAGDCEKPGRGSAMEGRRPFWDEEGMRSKPQLKQFRFGKRQEMATTHKEAVN